MHDCEVQWGITGLHSGLRKQWDQEFWIMGWVEHLWYSMCFTFSFTGTDVKQCLLWVVRRSTIRSGVPNSKFDIFQTVLLRQCSFWLCGLLSPWGLYSPWSYIFVSTVWCCLVFIEHLNVSDSVKKKTFVHLLVWVYQFNIFPHPPEWFKW